MQVSRVHTEQKILAALDHPFLATLYATLQTGRGEPSMRVVPPAVSVAPPFDPGARACVVQTPASLRVLGTGRQATMTAA